MPLMVNPSTGALLMQQGPASPGGIDQPLASAAVHLAIAAPISADNLSMNTSDITISLTADQFRLSRASSRNTPVGHR
jgi:hypothetical protein